MEQLDRTSHNGPVRRRMLALAIAAALGQVIAGPVLAEVDKPMEEIVVSASRRATSVQEVPFNLVAISGETLDRQRLRDLTSLSRWVPGLTVVDQGSRATSLMTVRGLNVSSLDASEFLGNSGGDTVQTYLGDIPLYLDLRMHDIERVEVLLGPQGTLYGAGTMGGAVRYIPRAPDLNRSSIATEGDVFTLAHGSGVGFEGNAAINVPLVEDRVALRASVSWLDEPGFIDAPYLVRELGESNPQPDFGDPAAVAANLHRAQDVNAATTVSSRVALLVQPNDKVQATFNFYHQEQDAEGRSVNHRHSLGLGHYESGHRMPEPNDRSNSLLSAEVIADLGFAELTSATGFSEYDELGQRDQTDLLLLYGYDEFPSFVGYTRDEKEEQRINQELRLVSKGTGPWGWIGGLYYNDYEINSGSAEYTPGWSDWTGEQHPNGDLEYRQRRRAALEEYAAFGEISYRFAPRWQATLGGRFFAYDAMQWTAVEFPFFSDEAEERSAGDDDDGFLGKLNVAYDLNETSLAYLTVSEGYRVGVLNAFPECPDPLPDAQLGCLLPHEVLVEPDRTKNYEIGFRTGSADGLLTASAALFLVDWDKIQVDGQSTHGGLRITVNGSEARSRGLELSLQARTAGPWSFSGSYAYVDAQLTADAPGLDALSGDRLAGTPEHQGSFHADYSRRLRSGFDLHAGYGLTFTSNVLTTVGQRADGETLGGYTVHRASVGLSKDTWSATLYADNLFDKFAETAVRADPGWIVDIAEGIPMRRYFRYVLRPRTVGLQVRYQFGD